MEPLTLSALVRYHVATQACPLPPAQPGITWIVAANGTFKRGVDQDRDILIQTSAVVPKIPGLAALMPYVRFAAWPRRLPAQLLYPLLADARRAVAPGTSGLVQPIERQYFLVWRDGMARLVAPHNQQGTPGRVQYQMPRGTVLCDLHSHHQMGAFFSGTDDRDDTGLSVSAVIGLIFSRPQIGVRLNVYGDRQTVSSLLVFDGLGPFEDRYAIAPY